LSDFSLKRIEHELFEKSGHLAPRNNSIAVEVKLVEEPIELEDGWWWLVMVLQEVLKEVHGLCLVEIVAAIDIIVVPNFIDLLTNVLIALELWESYRCLSGIVQEFLDESGHFLLLNEAISVFVKLEEESLVSLHVWSRLALGSTEVSEEASSLNFVQGTASVDVVLEPDLVDLVSDVVLLVKVSPSVELRLWPHCQLAVSSRRVMGRWWESVSLVRKNFMLLFGVIKHQVIQSLLGIVDGGVHWSSVGLRRESASGERISSLALELLGNLVPCIYNRWARNVRTTRSVREP
jgi:hypothetical protein